MGLAAADTVLRSEERPQIDLWVRMEDVRRIAQLRIDGGCVRDQSDPLALYQMQVIP